jgi:hypothetical protein
MERKKKPVLMDMNKGNITGIYMNVHMQRRENCTFSYSA